MRTSKDIIYEHLSNIPNSSFLSTSCLIEVIRAKYPELNIQTIDRTIRKWRALIPETRKNTRLEFGIDEPKSIVYRLKK